MVRALETLRLPFPSEFVIVAVIIPDVKLFSVFASEARILLSTVIASSPKPVMPSESKAVLRVTAAPVSVVMAEASMLPVVLPSRALRTEAVREESVRVTS